VDDDLCIRIRSYELAFIEVVAQIDREHVIHGLVMIGEGVSEDTSPREKAIRKGAIDLLRRALDRYDRPEFGLEWRD
jgi:hypothetical protein